jgi:hypothetical protein
MENFEATRCPTLVQNVNEHDIIASSKIHTAIYCPPQKFTLSDKLVRFERFLGSLRGISMTVDHMVDTTYFKNLLWTNFVLVHPACHWIYKVFVLQLYINANAILFSRNKNNRAMVGMYKCLVPDIWEVSIRRGHVHDTPDGICCSRLSLLKILSDQHSHQTALHPL